MMLIVTWMKRRWKLVAGVTCGLVLLAACLGVALSQIDQTITDEDVEAISKLGIGNDCAQLDSFEAEIRCVDSVQESHLTFSSDTRCTKVSSAIHHEPADFIQREYGCCFDRSRLIEKMLRHHGFETRHISIHMLELPFPIGYLEKGIRSHALSEVRTRRGWLAVDSLTRFKGLDDEGRVYSTHEVREINRDGGPTELRARFGEVPEDFTRDYHISIGLYSRHGRFYSPFVPVPDIDWPEFIQNVY